MSEIKTFTAKEMHHAPRQVFREADVNGTVQINHDHYPDKIFTLTSRDRNKGNAPAEDSYILVCRSCGSESPKCICEHIEISGD